MPGETGPRQAQTDSRQDRMTQTTLGHSYGGMRLYAVEFSPKGRLAFNHCLQNSFRKSVYS